MINYQTLKSLLFKLDPELAHKLAELFLRTANITPAFFNKLIEKNFIIDDRLKQNIFDVDFYNPIGLAAGFDKNASMIKGTLSLGFGFTEVGTITPKEQAGNPKPRLFRHIREEALQNAMGFNNDGALAMQKNLKKVYPFVVPIGINIGKNKITPEKEAISDYISLIKGLSDLGDYMVINISSPNTPNLRDLQNEDFIKAIFSEAKKITSKPILLKIAPDMLIPDAVELCKTAVKYGAGGIIATNTTIDYSLVSNPKDIGGLSGAILKEKSFRIFDAIAKELYGKTILISVGGIDDAKEAYRRLRAGASLVQIYTALIYKGPSLIRDINLELIKLMKKDGFKTINDVIGCDR